MSFNIPDKYSSDFSIDYFKSEKDENFNENSKSIFGLRKELELGDPNYLADKLIDKEVEENLDKSLKIDSFNIDENFNIETTVEFKQSNIIYGGQQLPEKLIKINLKFNGLCELICNKILIDDLLGKGEGDFLKKKINVDELNKESIVKSHLLNVYSFFSRMVAFIFGIYPDNVFSIKNQWNLVNKNEVNKEVLFNGLKKIKLGTTLKLEVFKRTPTSFSGHSLLVKKNNENEFTFFDPNTGEHRGLSQEGLALKINDQLAQWGGTDIFISRGDVYIKRLRDKNIIDKATSIIKSQ